MNHTKYNLPQVKEYFIENEIVSAYELYRGLGIAKSTAHHIIKRFTTLGGLVKDKELKLDGVRRRIHTYRVVDINIIINTILEIISRIWNDIKKTIGLANRLICPVLCPWFVLNIIKKSTAVHSSRGVGTKFSDIYNSMSQIIGNSIEKQVEKFNEKAEELRIEKEKKEKFKYFESICKNGNINRVKNVNEMFDELFNLPKKVSVAFK